MQLLADCYQVRLRALLSWLECDTSNSHKKKNNIVHTVNSDIDLNLERKVKEKFANVLKHREIRHTTTSNWNQVLNYWPHPGQLPSCSTSLSKAERSSEPHWPRYKFTVKKTGALAWWPPLSQDKTGQPSRNLDMKIYWFLHFLIHALDYLFIYLIQLISIPIWLPPLFHYFILLFVCTQCFVWMF